MNEGQIALFSVIDPETGAERIISFDLKEEEFTSGYAHTIASTFDAHSIKEVESLAHTFKLTPSGKQLLGQDGIMKLGIVLRNFVINRVWEDEQKLNSAKERFLEIFQTADKLAA